MDKKMQALVDAPLADALRLNIVAESGVAKKRSPRKQTLNMFVTPAPIMKNAAAHKEREEGAKLKALFDYYATTAVPFERIAEHLKLPLDQVRTSMSFRGRVQ